MNKEDFNILVDFNVALNKAIEDINRKVKE